MPITKVNGVITEGSFDKKDEFDRSGVIRASEFAIAGDDVLKQIQFDPSPMDTDKVLTLKAPAASASRTVTFPDGTDTLVGRASTDTLTNKTLTSPVVNGATTASGVGAKNGATVSVVEKGEGTIHQTVLTLTATPVTVANTTGASFGGVKLYDFPEGRILLLGATANLSFSWAGEDIAADGSGDFSLGSTITADATLDGTDVDMLPSSAMLDPFVAGVGTGTGALAASAQFDGTATAKDLNLNIIIDDADVSDGASDVVSVTGTVTITWINLGDY